MRSKPEIFEKHAARCDRRAALAGRGDLETLYRDLARQWREMAEQVRELQRMGAMAAPADHADDPPPM